MIFFTENIGEYINSEGQKRKPITCKLTDDRVGFYLKNTKKEEIEVKGIIVETITKSDLVIGTEI